MDELRIGLLGAGRWARAAHVASLSGHDGVRIAAIASAGGTSAGELARSLDAAACAPEELCERDDVDAVIVATPPPTHAALVRSALAARKPVLCELPLAPDAALARALLEEAERIGVAHGTTRPRPYLHGGEQVRDLLQEGAIGAPQAARLVVRLPEEAAAGRGDGYPLLAGLGASVLVRLFGTAEVAGPDRLLHTDGVESALDLALGAPPEGGTGLTVEGTDGQLLWDWGRPGRIALHCGGATREADSAPAADLGSAFPYARDFADAVRSDQRPSPDFDEGVAALELAQALFMARGS